MNAKKNNRFTGAVVLPGVLAVATLIYLLEAVRNVRPMEEGTAGPSFFPIVVSIAMMAALIPLLVKGWRQSAGSGEGGNAPSAIRLAEPIKVVVVTILYIALFKPAGYFIATALYVLALLYVFRFSSRHGWLKFLWAILIAGGCFILFSEIFQIRLPKLGEFI